jgi:glycosyltransferase involved in cell wall biosynthesis
LRRILFCTLSSIDNDSRVLKEISTLTKNGFEIVSLSVNTKSNFKFISKVVNHLPETIFGIPGLALIKLYFIYFRNILSEKEINIMHCNDLNTLPVGVFAKMFNRKLKLVYDSHEYAINDTPYESKISIWLKYFIERVLIQFADKVITVSNSIANEYKRLYNIPKPSLILNCPRYHDQQKKDIFRNEFNIRSDQNIFLYQGALPKGRGIEIMIQVFESFKSDDNVLIFMGFGQLESLIKDKARVLKYIYFKHSVSSDILLEYTSSADYGISFTEDSCLNHRYCLPNKLFEYFMAGIPVIVSNLYEMKSLVEKYQVGIVSKENTVQGLENAIKEVVKLNQDDLNKNIQKVKKIYNWEEQEKKLIKIYKELS